jgi:hypothetical protein
VSAAPGPLGGWAAAMVAGAARRSDLGGLSMWLVSRPVLVPVGAPLIGVLVLSVVVYCSAWVLAGLVQLDSSSLRGAGDGGGEHSAPRSGRWFLCGGGAVAVHEVCGKTECGQAALRSPSPQSGCVEM